MKTEITDKKAEKQAASVMPSTAKQKCACCGNEIANEPIKIMHNQMHRYVCSEKCMWDFYK